MNNEDALIVDYVSANRPIAGFRAESEQMAAMPKGTKHLDQLSKLAIGAGMEASAARPELADRRTAVITATSGSLQSAVDYYVRSVDNGASTVSPRGFPSTVLNCASSQIALHIKCEGPNATLTSGNTSLAAALRYARLLFRSDLADRALVVGAEEKTVSRVHERLARGALAEETDLGEGGIALVVRPNDGKFEAGAKAPLRVLAAARIAGGAKAGVSLTEAIERALDEGGLEASTVNEVRTTCDFRPDLRDIERQVVESALARTNAEVIPLSPSIGDLGAATSMTRISEIATAVLGTVCLITSIESDGSAGAVVVAVGTSDIEEG
ncbi:beta-ketoacyl synthase N-terminal-like domain-containing protein [Tsukamurella ocularis]|uniref:beta-ketoacyl synthase N-terminal-like domain-containing protein n=1 Tax=Tsukamurella ocularis TaxID=1970234 RepID=UPI002168F6C9|nr:beta-ketoacyl synthase N-terminal-like domain-containing protein [Tsukamurella ocularis]MCS3779334.1 3-oxoacyl-(acyl-carrier-protein) synthase [Tsukamurella ocularis]MCS3789940.1 3-oxoacyl-(acyl-carrier-protein) synthase [Tsukamurella ocularis]MCS3852437.1 3-oxoacyl-(acyl-carrier-protein) synthase [Tsukamurella ocularis]